MVGIIWFGTVRARLGMFLILRYWEEHENQGWSEAIMDETNNQFSRLKNTFERHDFITTRSGTK